MTTNKDTVIVDTFNRGEDEPYMSRDIDPQDDIHIGWLRTHVRWCAQNGRDVTISHKDGSA